MSIRSGKTAERHRLRRDALLEDVANRPVSTLRRYVEALGGELEVTATFGDKRIRLHGV